MNRHRQALADEKALLLQQIALQRLDLHREVMHTEQLCQRLDRSLGVLWRLRRPLSLIGGVIAVYAARHPSRLMGGARRVVALWSALRLARRTFYP
ncbi:YqjK family protein [Edwardsiella tarda]|uniref:YqjK family protein n=1 Tax=Edwardsiella tarda TaxID=636 RepID=UPI000D5093E6|nr:YqjK family protein [Edwardsiella tarda]UCQ10984.1 YqjK-like family protein [Edwardsiella tarda]